MKDNIIVICGFTLGILLFPASIAAPAAVGTSLAFDYRLGTPVRIIIPKADVNAIIRPIGKDRYGYMETPPDASTVGWYKYGVKPGGKGSSVLDGHLDSETAPGVLYAVKYLRPGDEIFIVDSKQGVLAFAVIDAHTYDAYAFPIAEIFGSNKERIVQLITCDGEFDTLRHTYMERLVVSAKLL